MLGKLLKKLRIKFYTTLCLRNVTHGERVYVNFKSRFTSKTTIGNNCHFNGMNITGNGRVTIGDNFHSGGGCLMITSNHNYDSGKAIPYDDTYIDGDVTIDENVWLGSNVTILGGVHIGEGAIIQAGSVVVSDIEPCAIAGGHPAQVFKKRDEMHYYSLKEREKFH